MNKGTDSEPARRGEQRTPADAAPALGDALQRDEQNENVAEEDEQCPALFARSEVGVGPITQRLRTMLDPGVDNSV